MNNFSFKKNFAHITDEEAQKLQLLPLSHNTDIDSFHNILDNGKLKPENCSLFDQKMVYFFYGTPLYNKTNWSYPIFILVNPTTKILKIQSLSPCDTGGLLSGNIRDKNKKGKKIKKKTIIERYTLDATNNNYHITTRKMIKCFFGTNKNYLNGEFIVKRKDLKTHFAEEYFDLGGTESEFYDYRAKAIEVHNVSEVNLDITTIEYIIVPEEKVHHFAEVFKGLEKKIHTYPKFTRKAGLSAIIDYSRRRIMKRSKKKKKNLNE